MKLTLSQFVAEEFTSRIHEETFDINYYFYYFYCLFIHCWQKKVSHNLENKAN